MGRNDYVKVEYELEVLVEEDSPAPEVEDIVKALMTYGHENGLKIGAVYAVRA